MEWSESWSNLLRSTYDQGAALLTSNSYDPEPFAVTQAAEAHRWFWKPETVHTLLIAESHVFTSANEVGTSVSCSPRELDLPHEIPPEFVRLVYCLGYGENSLLSMPAIKNSGTWQYWDMFGDLACKGKQPRRLQSTFSERMTWKIQVLRTLHAKGIWLVDASVHAIYKPGGKRVDQTIADRFHAQWWHGYGGEMARSLAPKQTFVIGRGLSKTLKDSGVKFDDWLYQPNSRIDTATRLAQMENFKRTVAAGPFSCRASATDTECLPSTSACASANADETFVGNLKFKATLKRRQDSADISGCLGDFRADEQRRRNDRARVLDGRGISPRGGCPDHCILPDGSLLRGA